MSRRLGSDIGKPPPPSRAAAPPPKVAGAGAKAKAPAAKEAPAGAKAAQSPAAPAKAGRPPPKAATPTLSRAASATSTPATSSRSLVAVAKAPRGTASAPLARAPSTPKSRFSPARAPTPREIAEAAKVEAARKEAEAAEAARLAQEQAEAEAEEQRKASKGSGSGAGGSRRLSARVDTAQDWAAKRKAQIEAARLKKEAKENELSEHHTFQPKTRRSQQAEAENQGSRTLRKTRSSLLSATEAPAEAPALVASPESPAPQVPAPAQVPAEERAERPQPSEKKGWSWGNLRHGEKGPDLLDGQRERHQLSSGMAASLGSYDSVDLDGRCELDCEETLLFSGGAPPDPVQSLPQPMERAPFSKVRRQMDHHDTMPLESVEELPKRFVEDPAGLGLSSMSTCAFTSQHPSPVVAQRPVVVEVAQDPRRSQRLQDPGLRDLTRRETPTQVLVASVANPVPQERLHHDGLGGSTFGESEAPQYSSIAASSVPTHRGAEVAQGRAPQSSFVTFGSPPAQVEQPSVSSGSNMWGVGQDPKLWSQRLQDPAASRGTTRTEALADFGAAPAPQEKLASAREGRSSLRQPVDLSSNPFEELFAKDREAQAAPTQRPAAAKYDALAPCAVTTTEDRRISLTSTVGELEGLTAHWSGDPADLAVPGNMSPFSSFGKPSQASQAPASGATSLWGAMQEARLLPPQAELSAPVASFSVPSSVAQAFPLPQVPEPPPIREVPAAAASAAVAVAPAPSASLLLREQQRAREAVAAPVVREGWELPLKSFAAPPPQPPVLPTADTHGIFRMDSNDKWHQILLEQMKLQVALTQLGSKLTEASELEASSHWHQQQKLQLLEGKARAVQQKIEAAHPANSGLDLFDRSNPFEYDGSASTPQKAERQPAAELPSPDSIPAEMNTFLQVLASASQGSHDTSPPQLPGVPMSSSPGTHSAPSPAALLSTSAARAPPASPRSTGTSAYSPPLGDPRAVALLSASAAFAPPAPEGPKFSLPVAAAVPSPHLSALTSRAPPPPTAMATMSIPLYSGAPSGMYDLQKLAALQRFTQLEAA